MNMIFKHNIEPLIKFKTNYTNIITFYNYNTLPNVKLQIKFLLFHVAEIGYIINLFQFFTE